MSKVKFPSYVAEEVLSGTPTMLERIGGYLIAILLLGFLAFAAIVPVPEKIVMPVTVSSFPEAGAGYASRRARLQKLFASEGDMITRGAPVAVLETTVSYNAALELKLALEKGAGALSQQQLPRLGGLGAFEKQLGVLRQALTDYRQQIAGQSFHHEMKALTEEIANRRLVSQTLIDNKAVAMAKLAALKEEKDIRDSLYKDGVGSRLNVQAIKSQIFDQESRILGLRQQLEENELLIASLSRQLDGKAESRKQQMAVAALSLENAVSSVVAKIEAWEKENLLTAPTDGILRIAGPWDEQRYVEAGELVFVVQPKTQALMATGAYEGRGLGQAAVGNLALVSLDDYPRQRFGKLRGRLEALSTVVVDGTQFVRLSLEPQTMLDGNGALVFKQGMTGQAELITEPQTLLNRLWQAFDMGRI